MNEHLATVQAAYEAFGKGDIPAILALLAPEVEWEHDRVDHGIPWIAPRRSPAGVAEFFATLADIEFHQFLVRNLLAGGDQVAAVIFLDATVKSTGKRIQDLEVHLWTFDAAGRVARFRHFIDTHLHLGALG